MRGWWIVAVVGLGCTAGGAGGGDDGCATHEDCASEERCSGPNDPQACGIPPMEDCSSSSECGTDMFCTATFDPCSPDGIGSECAQSCDESTTACAAGMDCVAGGCVPTLCQGDGDCPAHQVCDPTSVDVDAAVHAKTDGCVSVSCTADDSCGEGGCVNGFCQDTGGTCVEDVAVP